MDLIKPFEIDLCAKKDTGNIGTWKFGTDDTKSESNSGDECGKGSIFFFFYGTDRKGNLLDCKKWQNLASVDSSVKCRFQALHERSILRLLIIMSSGKRWKALGKKWREYHI